MRKTKKILRTQKLPTKKAISKLKKKAESLVHEYVRKRSLNFRGYFSCYTCKEIKPSDQCNAGHRWHGKLDLSLDNLKAQCIRCNNWLHGNLGMYERHLIEDYGLEWAKNLERRAAQDVKKYTLEELTKIIEEYTNLLKTL